MNTFGEHFTFTSFGESHGRAIGGVLDGVPAFMGGHTQRGHGGLAVHAVGQSQDFLRGRIVVGEIALDTLNAHIGDAGQTKNVGGHRFGSESAGVGEGAEFVKGAAHVPRGDHGDDCADENEEIGAVPVEHICSSVKIGYYYYITNMAVIQRVMLRGGAEAAPYGVGATTPARGTPYP